MSKPNLQRILNEERIKHIESLIVFLKSNLSYTDPSAWFYQKMKGKLDEYMLEYKERTGKDFIEQLGEYYPSSCRHIEDER